MRFVTVCLLAVAVAVCGLPSAAAAKKRSACQALTRFKDRAPSPKLVIVRRGTDESGYLDACVLPRGKLRRLVSWDNNDGGAAVVATNGTWALYGESHSGFGSSRSLRRIDVLHDKRFMLEVASCPPYGYDCAEEGSGADFGDAAIAPTGAGAFERTPITGPGPLRPTTLMAFSPAGTLTKLFDSGVDTLRATSKQITWTLGAAGFSAPTPG